MSGLCVSAMPKGRKIQITREEVYVRLLDFLTRNQRKVGHAWYARFIYFGENRAPTLQCSKCRVLSNLEHKQLCPKGFRYR